MPVLDENMFSADLTENDEIEEIILKKDKQNLLTSMKINQINNGQIIEIKRDIGDVTAAKNDVLAQQAKIYSLRCKMEMDDLFSMEKSFEKKDDVKRHIFIYKRR